MHSEKFMTEEMKVGAKLGAIIQDESARAELIDNPKATLADAGVKAAVTLYADTADTVHLVIPATVDSARVAADDETYFEELGRLALGSCMYEDMPD